VRPQGAVVGAPSSLSFASGFDAGALLSAVYPASASSAGMSSPSAAGMASPLRPAGTVAFWPLFFGKR
jgi:hypothetical protein